MSKAKVIFTLDGIDISIQCTNEELFKDICQKYANKIEKNINSLVFLYSGQILNLQLSFQEKVNSIDKERNEMKILVYLKENEEFICPKCGEKIKLNTERINDIISSINNLNENINGAKLLIENIIKTSSNNSINIQLKSINLILDTLNEDIKKINNKFKNIIEDNINNKLNKSNINEDIQNNNNYIIAEINIKDEDINKDIRILNSYEECLRAYQDINWLKDEIYKNEDEIKKCEIKINDELISFNYFYKFKSKGKYIIKYSFKNILKNTTLMFYECKLLNIIDLSNFNTNNIIIMNCMFYGCSSLTNINLSNFNTNNVTNMSCMFYGCSSLNNINLSNFNTNKVTNMSGMFDGYSSLTNINLTNINTNKVTNMCGMFRECSSLTNINLSNFNTNNVTDMRGMFYGCSSLTNINLSNFNTNKVTNMNSMLSGCKSLNKKNIITKDKRILKIKI